MVRNLFSLMLCILSALPVSHLRGGGLPVSLSMTGVVINSLVLTLLHHYAAPFPSGCSSFYDETLSVRRPSAARLTAAERMV